MGFPTLGEGAEAVAGDRELGCGDDARKHREPDLRSRTEKGANARTMQGGDQEAKMTQRGGEEARTTQGGGGEDRTK